MLRTLVLAAAAAPVAFAYTSWSIIAPNVGTVASGISMDADGQTGFLPADDNGSGAKVLRTLNGGTKWGAMKNTQFDLLLLDVASFNSSVEVVGVLSDQYSNNNGGMFNYSTGGAAGVQCVRVVGAHDAPVGFGFPVDGGEGAEGVAISTDGGATFTQYTTDLVRTGARYAAFPSADVWYMVAGEWPGESVEEEAKELGLDLAAGDQLVQVTERVHIAKWANGTSRYVTRRKGINAPMKSSVGKEMYLMQIVVTTDGGKTWTLTYNETHEWYGNGIECTSTTNCCVVGEADSGAAAGSYIWCTSNGGQSWAITHNNTNPDSSLIDIAAVGPSTLWAVGGLFNSIGPAAAEFWQSTDGGQTWAMNSSISQQYAMAVDCVPTVNNCWSVTVDLEQQASVASMT